MCLSTASRCAPASRSSGRDHPFIRTEYFLEEIDDEGSLFGPARRAQMRGDHPRQRSATPGKVYALLMDVAGAEESAECGVRVRNYDGSSGSVPQSSTPHSAIEQGRYRPHCGGGGPGGLGRPAGYAAHVSCGGPQAVGGHAAPATLRGDSRPCTQCVGGAVLVVDATGVGAGLAGFLGQALPGKVVPFVFSAQSKSQLGLGFPGAGGERAL